MRWLNRIISIASLGFSLICAQEPQVARVYSHLLLSDYDGACEEASTAVKLYPNDSASWQAFVISSAKKGDEQAMIAAWNRFRLLSPEAAFSRKVLEEMAWGVINKASCSPAPLTRLIALLGAFHGQDARGVLLISNHLADENSLVRGVAVELASHLPDAILQEGVFQLFRRENVWKVRLEAIEALGHMQVSSAKPELIAIISEEQYTAEEKVAAINALVNLIDSVERTELLQLTNSPRAGLRLLACDLITHFELDDSLDLVQPLLHDPSNRVRTAALRVFGVLRRLPSHEALERTLNDPDSTVALHACWVLTLSNPREGQAAFSRWLTHGKRETRILAASLLGACGQYGMPLIEEGFKKSSDPYVQMNLALALLSQQIATHEACETLYKGLRKEKEKWVWHEYGCGRALMPNRSSLSDDPLESPQVVDQLVRIEILNLLAVSNFPDREEAILHFLQKEEWGVTGTAAAFLLTEGEESALDLIVPLLSHSASKVRIQAALILSLWGQREDALQTLQTSYSSADRDLKAKILEGIGAIGSKSSIPFLLERLKEPAQPLRVIAASSLLKCLYH